MRLVEVGGGQQRETQEMRARERAKNEAGHCLYLGVLTKLLIFGISRLVALLRLSMVIPIGFILFPYHQTRPQLLQDLEIIQSTCGTCGQETVIVFLVDITTLSTLSASPLQPPNSYYLHPITILSSNGTPKVTKLGQPMKVTMSLSPQMAPVCFMGGRDYHSSAL